MAVTVNTLERHLSKYIEPDSNFLDTLNRLMPRIYGMGYWRDLVYETTVRTDHAYFALPRGAESVIAAMVDDLPAADINAQWHDYKIAGLTQTGPSPLFGIVDDGFDATMIDLARTSETYEIQVDPIAPATTLPSSGSVIVVYEKEDETLATHTFTLAGEATLSTSFGDGNQAISVRQIRFNNVLPLAANHDIPLDVRVTAVADSAEGTDLIIAEGRGDEVARYRRYRFNHDQPGTYRNVHLLMKRAWVPLIRETEVVYFENIQAMKHAILGEVAEDHADVDRADYHWGVCRGLLAEELDAYRAAAKPKAILDLTGVGDSAIPNIQ